jgi:hypothetical protein
MIDDHILRIGLIAGVLSELFWWRGRHQRKEFKDFDDKLNKMTQQEKDKEFEKFRDVFKDPSK